METEHDQFEQVRRLLALKKHEQPPPRYFQEFSGKVIARIHALENAGPVTWRQRLGLDFNLKPALIGVFGVAACGLLLMGVITSLGVTSPSAPSFGLLSDPTPFGSPTMSASAGGPSLGSALNPNEIPASTVPVGGDPSSSPFGLLAPRAERASFKFAPGN